MQEVFARLFQKAARLRARSPHRRPQAAKTLMALSFCQAFSLRLLHQRKSGLWFYATLQSLYLLSTTSGAAAKIAAAPEYVYVDEYKAISPQTGELTDICHRCPAAVRLSSCPCFRDGAQAQLPPMSPHRRKCPPARLLFCLSAFRWQKHPHF